GWPVKGGCIRYGLPTSLTCSCGAPPISVLGCTASIIVLRLSPERGEWLLWLPQDENGSVVLKVHTYGAGRSGGQCHRVVRLRCVLRRDIDRDEHLTTTSIWSPEIKGVVPADRRWQMIASAVLDKRASLPIVFGKDAGDPLLIRWQAVIDLRDQGNL